MTPIVDDAGTVLAYVFRPDGAIARTTFLTPHEAPLQVGFVVYPAGGAVAPHAHVPVQRSVRGTAEVIIVQRGRCAIDVFDDAQRLVATHDLHANDVVVLVAGGHGFRMQDDTVLLEVKQGPYLGPEEKVRFTPA